MSDKGEVYRVMRKASRNIHRQGLDPGRPPQTGGLPGDEPSGEEGGHRGLQPVHHAGTSHN
eukprot:8605662-Prorocentrum_lima.AAC.1